MVAPTLLRVVARPRSPSVKTRGRSRATQLDSSSFFNLTATTRLENMPRRRKAEEEEEEVYHVGKAFACI